MNRLETLYDVLQKVIGKKQEGRQCVIMSPWGNRQDSIIKDISTSPTYAVTQGT